MSLPIGDPAKHFFITRSVARVMGVSLTDAMQENRLAPESYSGMVTRCRGCALVTTCEDWLASQMALSPTPPPGCCNTFLLRELAQP
jgi:hypothetical protein